MNDLITLPGKIFSSCVYGTEHLPILSKEYDLYEIDEFQNGHDGDLFFIDVIPVKGPDDISVVPSGITISVSRSPFK